MDELVRGEESSPGWHSCSLFAGQRWENSLNFLCFRATLMVERGIPVQARAVRRMGRGLGTFVLRHCRHAFTEIHLIFRSATEDSNRTQKNPQACAFRGMRSPYRPVKLH